MPQDLLINKQCLVDLIWLCNVYKDLEEISLFCLTKKTSVIFGGYESFIEIPQTGLTVNSVERNPCWLIMSTLSGFIRYLKQGWYWVVVCVLIRTSDSQAACNDRPVLGLANEVKWTSVLSWRRVEGRYCNSIVNYSVIYIILPQC